MIREARAGHVVVRLKGGDPFVFGRGGEELAALRAAGIDVESCPASRRGSRRPAAVGIPVTHRGVAHGVALVTGHAPTAASEPDWRALVASRPDARRLHGHAARRASCARRSSTRACPRRSRRRHRQRDAAATTSYRHHAGDVRRGRGGSGSREPGDHRRRRRRRACAAIRLGCRVRAARRRHPDLVQHVEQRADLGVVLALLAGSRNLSVVSRRTLFHSATSPAAAASSATSSRISATPPPGDHQRAHHGLVVGFDAHHRRAAALGEELLDQRAQRADPRRQDPRHLHELVPRCVAHAVAPCGRRRRCGTRSR